MSNDSLHDRGQALEDAFFAEKDRLLLDKLKSELSAKEALDALAAASGIADEYLLNQLVANQVRSETLASVALIPLVAVAWADGRMEDKERDAILKAMDQAGIKKGEPSHELVKSWLAHPPGNELLDSWKAYIGSLAESLDAAAMSQLKSSVLGQAQTVADAAGGFLGMGPRTSAAEKRLLEDLDLAFG